MRYLITYRPDLGLPPEIVEADSVSQEGRAHLVLRGITLVMGQPREYVVRRLRQVDVVRVAPEAE